MVAVAGMDAHLASMARCSLGLLLDRSSAFALSSACCCRLGTPAAARFSQYSRTLFYRWRCVRACVREG